MIQLRIKKLIHLLQSLPKNFILLREHSIFIPKHFYLSLGLNLNLAGFISLLLQQLVVLLLVKLNRRQFLRLLKILCL